MERDLIKIRLQAILRECLTQICEMADKQASDADLDALTTTLAAQVDATASAIAALPQRADRDKAN